MLHLLDGKKKKILLFLNLLVMAPELGYLAKMYILHHQVDLPNYNTLSPSVIPF